MLRRWGSEPAYESNRTIESPSENVPFGSGLSVSVPSSVSWFLTITTRVMAGSPKYVFS